MIEFIYWLTLNCVVLTPIYLIVRHVRNFAFLPVVLYGLSLWAFLVVGLPLESNNLGRGMNFNLSFYVVIITVTIPIYVFAFMGMSGKTFARRSVEINLQNQVHLRTAQIIYIVLWSIILLCVARYFVVVGRPPIFDASIFDIIGSAKELKAIRKAYTYTPEFRQYKFFFYSAPPLAALVGYCLYLNRGISFLTNFLSVATAMILTVSFLHKQGPIGIVVMMFLLKGLTTGYRLREGMAVFFMVIILLLGVFAFYLGDSVNVLELLTRAVKRIFGDYTFTLEFALDSFPSKFPFFYGATLPNPGDIFSTEQVDLSGFTTWHLHGNAHGAAPVPAVGEFYVNFGAIGVLLFVFAIFTWLSFLSYIFYHFRRNPFGISLWVFLSFKIINCNKQSFFSAANHKLLFFGLAFVGLYYIMVQFLKNVGVRFPVTKYRRDFIYKQLL